MSINRRVFLGAGAALGLAALQDAIRSAVAAETWDVIIVGGGTAGLPTALFAAERGRVLVIEKGPVLGGTLDRSTGQVAAAGTVFQKAKGITDTPDAHYADIMRINGNTSDPALTRLFVDHAGAAFNWLAANGYTVQADHPVTGFGHEHFRVRRYQWGPKGGWSIFEAMEPLIQRALAGGRLTILLNTTAAELIVGPDGSVRGVVTEDSTRRRADVYAKNVVLASGGCASNPHMFAALHGVPLYCQVAHPNSQGIGISLGLAAGGYVRGGESYLPLPGAILVDDRYPSPAAAIAPLNPTLRKPWEILVNSKGERFVREDDPSVHHIEMAIKVQPGERHWAIFDEEILDRAPPLIDGWSPQRLREACSQNAMFARADSLPELAVRSGIGAKALERSVDDYNRARAIGSRDPFGLEHRPLPIAKPPFYSVRMQGWTVISFAGIGVDRNLRVTTDSGMPIPNLYAVGEVIGAGATSGSAYTNGMLVSPAITFGRLLGMRILDFA